MKTKRSNKTKILRLCFCALLMAIVCVCTMVAIPLPIGFFNLGDAACILSAHLLGPFLGVIAAAIGSALADILLGYAVYAPATALIKGKSRAPQYIHCLLCSYFSYFLFRQQLQALLISEICIQSVFDNIFRAAFNLFGRLVRTAFIG